MRLRARDRAAARHLFRLFLQVENRRRPADNLPASTQSRSS